MMALRFLSLLGILLLAACSDAPESKPVAELEEPITKPSQFVQLTNWEQSNHSGALTAFLRSCDAWKNNAENKTIGCGDLAVKSKEWQDICTYARQVDTANANDVRIFFETHFTPLRVKGKDNHQGLFTGYYIPAIKGSKNRGGKYQTPVYGVPKDLKKNKPYATRGEIYAGKLEGKGLEIAWVDDPVGLFFIEVQGSGVIRLAEGGLMTIGYAAKNNRDYVAIGRTMQKQGLLEAGKVNLFTIKKWLYDNPERAKEVMAANPRYIFFQKLKDNAVRGAQGVPLTAMRSLAIDNRYIPYGMPVYVKTSLPKTSFGPEKPFNQLMIAQDTGGAIKGAVRGDIYFGHGKRAEALAGKQAMEGSYTLLVPKALKKECQHH